jgi:hypothetical protein
MIQFMSGATLAIIVLYFSVKISMRQFIKQILWVFFLAASMQITWAFSLAGPIGSGSDSAWQIYSIGYALGYNGELAAPKNWGQGYRRNTPVIYYGFDATFSSGENGFFGTNAGPAAVDSAFAVMNNLTNVSSYSTDLAEFPLDTRQENYLAYNLGMFDLKTVTLGLIIEQMGLVDPVLYSWTLHNRQGPSPGEQCPAGMTYEVVQRNFDPSSYADLTAIYSPYVNGTLYTYLIEEFCSGAGTPPNAITFPYSVDPSASAYSPIASSQNNLNFGLFYTGLTRDDIAGLRQLINANNDPVEDAPFGSTILETNALPPQLLTTTNYGGFLSSLLTNDPVTLEALFPGIEINYTATNYVPVVFTNISFFYTNLSVLPVFSSFIQGGFKPGFYFTNQPGSTIIDYDRSTPALFTTLDLGTFVDQAATNDPVTLQALYPNLVINSWSWNISFQEVTNYLYSLVNSSGDYYFTPPKLKIVPIGFSFIPVTNWTYAFGNVITNHIYSSRMVITQSITSVISGQYYYSPFILKTNYTTTFIPRISGDFFLIPTNWCGFDLLSAEPLGSNPLSFGPTNTIIFQGYTTNGTLTTNATVTTNGYGEIQNVYEAYTNYTYAIAPGVCEPALGIGTNYSTNVVTEYTYSFGNIFTNSFSPSTYVTVIITNITPVFGGASGQFVTNVTVTNFFANYPSGAFFITPSNWCGFNILANYFTNTVYVTNTFVATNITGNTTSTNVGQFSETIISHYTNDTYLVQGSICTNVAPVAEQRRGVEHIQFVRGDYDSESGYFFNQFTETFTMTTVTNGQDVVKTYQRIIATPDLLFQAADLVFHPGDVGLGNPLVDRSLTFNHNNVTGPGVIIPQQSFTFNSGGPVLDNYADLNLLDGQSYLKGYNYTNALFSSYFVWASFDGSTNLPVIYPQNISLSNLENQSLFRISPLTISGATNGVPYNVAFSVSGGQPPYSISLMPGSQNLLPNGLSLNGFIITGTPSATPGTYDFQLVLSDSGGRLVQYTYTITIH